jgi:hypothetical protein
MSPRASHVFARALLFLVLVTNVVTTCDAGAIAAQVRQLPDIPAPANGASAWVARAMRLNGVPMTIKRFTSSMNAEEVLHGYERTLRTRADMQTRRTQEKDWRVLAVMTGGYYATIRARDTNRGSEGTITVTPPLAHAKARKHTRFPHPRTAEILSVQEYDDDGIEAEHIGFVSRRSAALEARAFATALAKADWQLLRDEPTARHGGHVIEAQKAAEFAFINVRRAERGEATMILVVWRKA